jgi:hypothetical protein
MFYIYCFFLGNQLPLLVKKVLNDQAAKCKRFFEDFSIDGQCVNCEVCFEAGFKVLGASHRRETGIYLR